MYPYDVYQREYFNPLVCLSIEAERLQTITTQEELDVPIEYITIDMTYG